MFFIIIPNSILKFNNTPGKKRVFKNNMNASGMQWLWEQTGSGDKVYVLLLSVNCLTYRNICGTVFKHESRNTMKELARLTPMLMMAVF